MGDYYAQSNNQYNQNYPQQQNQPYYPQQQNKQYYPQQQNQQYYPQQPQPYQQQPAYSPPNYANNNTASNDALNSGGNGAGFHPEKFNKKSKYNDVWAALLFWVHLLGFAVLAYFAITAFRNPPAHLSTTSSSQVKIQVSPVVGISLALSTLAGFILSLIYFILMEKFASTVIKATFIASIIFFFAYAAYLFYIGAFIAAIIGLVLAVIYLACWFWWRSRIPFASVMLETVTGVTKKYKGTFGATIVGAIVQLAYNIFFFFTIIGVIYMTTDDPKDCRTTVNNKGQSVQSCPSDGKRAALTLFSIFSFYWVSQVIKTTVHVTVSGVFAAYYFLEGSTEGVPSSPTIGSAKRALTTSFGSICFGSLIIAIIRTVRTLLRNARDNSEGGFAYFIAACAECLLNWIESLVEYFNHYAYTQVAIYGKDYCTAAKDTWRMIKDRGVEAIINDNLIGTVLSMGAILIGGLTSLIVLLYLKINGASATEEIIICILAFVIGFAMMCLVGEVIESGTATTFVALAEDPQALARTKPFLFEKIRQTYPEIVVGV